MFCAETLDVDVLPVTDEVITLYRAARLIPRLARYRSNWTPRLLKLCRARGIGVVLDDAGIPCCRMSDVPRIAETVERHFDRPRVWPRKFDERPQYGDRGMKNVT